MKFKCEFQIGTRVGWVAATLLVERNTGWHPVGVLNMPGTEWLHVGTMLQNEGVELIQLESTKAV